MFLTWNSTWAFPDERLCKVKNRIRKDQELDATEFHSTHFPFGSFQESSGSLVAKSQTKLSRLFVE